MHTVGWLEFGEEERAANTFKMMLRNVNDPFKVCLLLLFLVAKTSLMEVKMTDCLLDSYLTRLRVNITIVYEHIVCATSTFSMCMLGVVFNVILF